MNFSAILLAAGSGTRYHGHKQDEVFHGFPLWELVYNTLLKVIKRDNIVVVGKTINGGNTRTESVKIGLANISNATDRVVIVEAARPLVTKKQIEILLNDQSKSSTFVQPLVNTVVYRNGDYIDRDKLYELLTPQAFDYKLLCEAYEKGDFNDVTDETRVMYEYHGIKPHFLETTNNLFKVTYPGDLKILECLYNKENYER